MHGHGSLWSTLDAVHGWSSHGFLLLGAWYLLQGHWGSPATWLGAWLAQSYLPGCVHVCICPRLGSSSNSADVWDIPCTCTRHISCHCQHCKLVYRLCHHKKFCIPAGSVWYVWSILAVWSMQHSWSHLRSALCTRDKGQVTRRYRAVFY